MHPLFRIATLLTAALAVAPPLQASGPDQPTRTGTRGASAHISS